MNKFWSPLVSRLQPYSPGEQPSCEKLIKLNTNENPAAPSPSVVAAIKSALANDGARLRLYPDSESNDLRLSLAGRYGLGSKHVFMGNGSDEVLAHIFPALLQRGSPEEPLLMPDICYSFYPSYCKLNAVDYRFVQLSDDFSIQVDDYLQPARAIIFPNPNAPTGILLPPAEIERLLAAAPDTLLIVDEAYIDFATDSAAKKVPSCAPLVAHYPNLLVVQTLSKSYALAGLRVGYALGHPALIEALQRVKNSFNSYPLDLLAQEGALAALGDDDYYNKTRDSLFQSRHLLSKDLRAIGFRVLPSAANFIFVSHAEHDAFQLLTGLRSRGILVRHFQAPRIEQFLRISIGSPDECQALLQALSELVEA